MSKKNVKPIEVTSLAVLKYLYCDYTDNGIRPFPRITFSDSLCRQAIKSFGGEQVADIIFNIHLEYKYMPDCPSLLKHIKDDLRKAFSNGGISSIYSRFTKSILSKGNYDANKIILLPERMSIEYFNRLSKITDSLFVSSCNIGNILPDFAYLYRIDLKKIHKHLLFGNIISSYNNYDFILPYLNDADTMLFMKILNESAWTNLRKSTVSEIFMNSLYSLTDPDIKLVLIRRIKGLLESISDGKEVNNFMYNPNFITSLSDTLKEISPFDKNGLTISYQTSKYVKKLLKNGLDIERALKIFTENNIAAYIQSDIIDDHIIEKIIKNRSLDKKEFDLLVRYRPKLFAKMSKSIITDKIRERMFGAIPKSVIDLINKGVIDIELKIKCDADSIELFQELNSL